MHNIVLHRTFEGERKGDATYYVVEDGKTQTYTGVKIDLWLSSLDFSCNVRITSLSTYLPVLIELRDRGVKISSCHWHDTGIQKGLDPQAIAEAFAALPDDIFKPFTLREDLYKLRSMIALRSAVMKFRIAACQKILEQRRSLGFSDDAAVPEWFSSAEKENNNDVRKAEKPIERDIKKLAKTIPECIQLNAILDVKDGWLTSASAVALIGDVHRFATVSKLWHYAGFHVVNGKAAKRAKGSVVTWNPELRCTLWKWADSMIKHRENIWRSIYDGYLAEELKVHGEKCKCETSQGHSGARARRRVIKNVLREYWLQICKPGQEYLETPKSRAGFAMAAD